VLVIENEIELFRDGGFDGLPVGFGTTEVHPVTLQGIPHVESGLGLSRFLLQSQ
jgi:hypothetical protein